MGAWIHDSCKLTLTNKYTETLLDYFSRSATGDP